MEILNYSESGRKSNFNGLLKSFSGRGSGSFSDRISTYPVDSYDGYSDVKSGHDFSLRASFLFFGRVLKLLLKFSWAAVFIFLCALIPFGIFKYFSYKDSFARPVNFVGGAESDFRKIEEILPVLALSDGYSFNGDGDIFDAEGNILVSSADFKEPVSFTNYKVQAGDTISGICQTFGLSNISTLIAMNDIENVRYLRSGQKLRIPSVDGMLHKVGAGENLQMLCAKYDVAVEDLLDVNNLETDVLSVGQEIFIPGARMDSALLQKAMGELFICPISASYRLTSKFGNREDPFSGVKGQFHGGIDMACPKGTPIKAAMSGTVVFTGFSNTYGNYVIIKHVDGYQTLYGHMSRITAKKDSFVSQGTVIGLVGSTGYSTGNHLHFTVYKNGSRIDPLTVLRIKK